MERVKEWTISFWKGHKKKVIVYASLILVSIIANRIILKSVYDYTVEQYEQHGDCVQVCEDGIATFRRMKYYKNAKNYIRQMTITAVEDYCEQNQYVEAENFLNENYDEDLQYLYAEITSKEKGYEEEQQRLEAEREAEQKKMEHDSTAGRTERVKKMYQTMGFGGDENGHLIIGKMVAGIEYASLDTIGYLLPVWNRNDMYFQMLMDWFHHCYDWVNGNSLHNLSVQYVKDSKMTKPNRNTVIQYFRRTYNIDIEIQDFKVYTFMLWQSEGINSGHGKEFEVFVFETDNRWFFGGFFSLTYDDDLVSVIPGNKYYNGIIDN